MSCQVHLPSKALLPGYLHQKLLNKMPFPGWTVHVPVAKILMQVIKKIQNK